MTNKLLFLLATITFLSTTFQGLAWADQDGKFAIYGQYESIKPPQPTNTPGKVEVVEMFWYGCPHCFYLEPTMDRWLKDKPDYVSFRRMPAVFRPSWVPHAKAFFAARALGVKDKVHAPLFEAIHVQKRPLDTRAQLAAFFAEQGVNKEDFVQAYDSFAVASQVRRASRMTGLYGINGVPAIIIDGKYRTSGSLAGSQENMIKVINTLVAEEHRAKSAMAVTRDAPKQRQN